MVTKENGQSVVTVRSLGIFLAIVIVLGCIIAAGVAYSAQRNDAESAQIEKNEQAEVVTRAIQKCDDFVAEHEFRLYNDTDTLIAYEKEGEQLNAGSPAPGNEDACLVAIKELRARDEFSTIYATQQQ